MSSQPLSLPHLESRLGARALPDDRCSFRVWAPRARQVELHVTAPFDRLISMTGEDRGYFSAVVEELTAGARYFYRLNGELERPDPASQSQPEGVHGASEVIRADFPWHDGEWRGIPLDDYVFYELHVGTFTAGGTFDAVIPYLDDLVELGITAIELMPVAQFSGSRNWGYDGVYPGATQNSYGGADGLRRLVDACHARGLALVLDVVYNHLGPEGNYFGEFGPYFTDRYKTPWGAAFNFDHAWSDEVRRFFIENALRWLSEFHIDALRLDAVHAIVDNTATPFLKELADAVRQLSTSSGISKFTIAESDLNDPRIVRSSEQCGLGIDSQWCDDFHHALHVLLTGEKLGYYAGYRSVGDLATVLEKGYLFTGQYSAYRGRRYGAPAGGLPGSKFVVSTQNHDQIGNRMKGDRLANSVPFPALKLAAGMMILSPFLPMLFMGEEYGETSPFQYFTSHSDPSLIEAVRHGRVNEFASFAWGGEVPDPHDEATFARSRLDRSLMERPENRMLWSFYRQLLKMRKTLPACRTSNLDEIEAMTFEAERVLMIRRHAGGKGEILIVASFSSHPVALLAELASSWSRLLDAEESQWLGGDRTLPETLSKGELRVSLPPYCFAVFEKTS